MFLLPGPQKIIRFHQRTEGFRGLQHETPSNSDNCLSMKSFLGAFGNTGISRSQWYMHGYFSIS